MPKQRVQTSIVRFISEFKAKIIDYMVVGVAAEISEVHTQRIIYRKRHTEFNVFSSYSTRDQRIYTDQHSLNDAITSQLK